MVEDAGAASQTAEAAGDLPIAEPTGPAASPASPQADADTSSSPADPQQATASDATSSQCAFTTTNPYATCTLPAYCSAGSAACLYPPPSPVPDNPNNLTGHLQTRPTIVPKGKTTRVFWNISNVSSCTVTGTNGDSWSGSTSGQPRQNIRPHQPADGLLTAMHRPRLLALLKVDNRQPHPRLPRTLNTLQNRDSTPGSRPRAPSKTPEPHRIQSACVRHPNL